MVNLPVEPDGATPEQSPSQPIPKPKRVKNRAAANRFPDFTVESLEGRDPPNNFQMLYDMALEAMLHADDYTQVSFASAPNRRPWQADEILADDNWTLSATSTHAGGGGGGGLLDPPSQAVAAADLFVGLNAGHPDLGFVQGLSRFDFGDAVFAGMAFDDGGQHQLAARPGGDAQDSPIFGDLAGSTIATSQLLSDTVLLDSPYIGPPSHGVPVVLPEMTAGLGLE